MVAGIAVKVGWNGRVGPRLSTSDRLGVGLRRGIGGTVAVSTFAYVAAAAILPRYPAAWPVAAAVGAGVPAGFGLPIVKEAVGALAQERIARTRRARDAARRQRPER